MIEYIVHPVVEDLEVRVTRAMPALTPGLDTRVEALWRVAAKRVAAGGAGRLFNGRVFSIDAISPHRIIGHWTEYRRVIAQAEDHRLFAELGVRSLSACGVLRCPDGVVIGRRPAAAVYQPGQWQLCPAGSVDQAAARDDGQVDYRSQLLTELREELGIDAADVASPRPLCVVEHPGSHVSDFGMAVETALDADIIRRTHQRRGNGEYDPLRIVPVADLPAFIDWAGRSLVAPAPIFLALAGLLPQGFSPPTGP